MAERITLIDDDPDFTGLVTEILQEYGWDVVVCHDDRTAIQCIQDARPALVILDVRMRTRESGWEILDRLWDDSSQRSIPVIVCTAALDDLRARKSWLEERGIATLAKPFDIDELAALIERMLADGSDNRAAPTASNEGAHQT